MAVNRFINKVNIPSELIQEINQNKIMEMYTVGIWKEPRHNPIEILCLSLFYPYLILANPVLLPPKDGSMFKYSLVITAQNVETYKDTH